MTDNAHIAKALRLIGEGVYELADALLDQPQVPSATPARAETAPAPPDTFSDGTPIEEPFLEEVDPIAPVLAATGGVEVGEGSLVSCPKHHVLYRDGRYGKYCPSVSDDPAWSNSKGFCKISPKNAAEYLRIKAAA